MFHLCRCKDSKPVVYPKFQIENSKKVVSSRIEKSKPLCRSLFYNPRANKGPNQKVQKLPGPIPPYLSIPTTSNAPKDILLPRKRLLDKVDIAVSLSVANRESDVIAQGTRPTDADAHGADLLVGLESDQGVDIGPAGEHLHRCGGGVDFLGGAGLGHEEEDAEDVAAVVHAEDGSHPGADPFEVFC